MSIIFFDIDGTIMDTDGSIPASTVAAIRRLQKKGHHCLINTGRPPVDLEQQLLDMNFDGLLCTCGQYILMNGQLLFHQGFDRETSLQILALGRKYRVDLYFEGVEKIWMDCHHQPLHREIQNAIARLGRHGVTIGSPDDDPDFRFDKFCALAGSDSRMEDFLAQARRWCQVIDRGGGMYELPKLGCSKATGCLLACRELGIPPEDCYAIGDSTNDMEMLRCVGHPIVMGNAPQQVRQLAEYVTGTLQEDGLSHALTHLGLLEG